MIVTEQASVVIEKPSTTYVSNTSDATVLLANTSDTFIVHGSLETVLIEAQSTEVILAGALGPQGPAGAPGVSEESLMYSKRVDFVTQNILYRGEADPGVLEATSLWRIRKVIIGSDDDVTETWADGSAEFTKTWSLRDQYTYI